MKISFLRDKYKSQYPNKIKIIRKGVFWIILNEEAFFMAKYFNFKITKLDNENIKIWFPLSSEKVRLKKLDEKWVWYLLIDKESKEWWEYFIKEVKMWNYFNLIFSINIEDYELTKKRILWLALLWLEEKNTKNFLLKDKLEELYVLLSHRLIKMPRKERYFFREKIERVYIDMLQDVYKYMYNVWDRTNLIKNIFDDILILREFTRFLYFIGKIKNDNAFLDMWERWIEVMKICKWIKNKIE